MLLNQEFPLRVNKEQEEIGKFEKGEDKEPAWENNRHEQLEPNSAKRTHRKT